MGWAAGCAIRYRGEARWSTRAGWESPEKRGRGCPSRHFQLDFPLPDSPGGYGLNG